MGEYAKALERQIQRCQELQSSVAKAVNASPSTFSRRKEASKTTEPFLREVGAFLDEKWAKLLKQKPVLRQEWEDSLPSEILARAWHIERDEESQRTQGLGALVAHIGDDEVKQRIADRLGSLIQLTKEPWRIRRNLRYSVNITGERVKTQDGYYQLVAKISWEGQLPFEDSEESSPPDLWVSFVRTEADLNEEFHEPGCIYRELVNGLSDDQWAKVKSTFDATLDLGGGQIQGTVNDLGDIVRIEFPGETARSQSTGQVELTVGAVHPIGMTYFPVKFDGYLITSPVLIEFDPPTELRRAEAHLFTCLVGESKEERLWTKASKRAANALEVRVRDDMLVMPGDSVLFTWEPRWSIATCDEDFKTVRHVHERSRELFQEEAPFVMDKGVPDDSVLREALDKRMLWKACDEQGNMVGFALAKDLGGMRFHLEQISVLPELSRSGIGTQLLEWVVAQAESMGFRTIGLITYRDIKWNGPWYRSQGFQDLAADDLDQQQRELFAHDASLIDEVAAGREVPPRVFMMRELAAVPALAPSATRTGRADAQREAN